MSEVPEGASRSRPVKLGKCARVFPIFSCCFCRGLPRPNGCWFMERKTSPPETAFLQHLCQRVKASSEPGQPSPMRPQGSPVPQIQMCPH